MNNGIFFFKNTDFVLRQNLKGKLLAFQEELKGLYLVLFYSEQCTYCDQLMSDFKLLPQKLLGCKFVMVNINKNPDIVEQARETICPITYVPDLILYVNGLPYIRYDGPNNLEDIKKFIIDIANKLEKTSFMEEANPPPGQHAIEFQEASSVEENAKIPEYTIGKPLCGSGRDEQFGVCYLNFNDAYTE
jgi:thioredoxin-like negative regulator of GroEL